MAAGRRPEGRARRRSGAKSWTTAEAARGAAGARRSGFALRQARRVARPAEEVDGRRASRQRIDKWLFFARVVKSRSLAAKLVQAAACASIAKGGAGLASGQAGRRADHHSRPPRHRLRVSRPARAAGRPRKRGRSTRTCRRRRRRSERGAARRDGAAARSRQRPADQEGTPRDADNFATATDGLRTIAGDRRCWNCLSGTPLPRGMAALAIIRQSRYLTGRARSKAGSPGAWQ